MPALALCCYAPAGRGLQALEQFVHQLKNRGTSFEVFQCSEADMHLLRRVVLARARVQSVDRIGANVIWFQPGTQSAEASAIAREAGLTVITRLCMGATHGTLGLGPGPHEPD